MIYEITKSDKRTCDDFKNWSRRHVTQPLVATTLPRGIRYNVKRRVGTMFRMFVISWVMGYTTVLQADRLLNFMSVDLK